MHAIALLAAFTSLVLIYLLVRLFINMIAHHPTIEYWIGIQGVQQVAADPGDPLIQQKIPKIVSDSVHILRSTIMFREPTVANRKVLQARIIQLFSDDDHKDMRNYDKAKWMPMVEFYYFQPTEEDLLLARMWTDVALKERRLLALSGTKTNA